MRAPEPREELAATAGCAADASAEPRRSPRRRLTLPRDPRRRLRVLRRAIRTVGDRVVDGRTKLGKALAAWRADLAADLGGADQLSTQQRALLDEAVKLKLMLDSVDAWVLAQPSLVNKAKRCLLPVVRERLALVGQLQSLLRDLGLERRVRDVPDLRSYLATRQPATTDGARTMPT